MYKNFSSLLSFTLLTSCSGFAPVQSNVALYDFGVDVKKPEVHVPATLQVSEIMAPSWLDSRDLRYRLRYVDGSLLRTYAETRWAAPPTALFSKRLRQQLAMASDGVVVPADSVKSGCVLKVELQEFSQIFDSPQSSHARITARVSLVGNGDRNLLAQKHFDIEHKADSPDARGGVTALVATSDELIGNILLWLSENLDTATPEGDKNYKQCHKFEES